MTFVELPTISTPPTRCWTFLSSVYLIKSTTSLSHFCRLSAPQMTHSIYYPTPCAFVYEQQNRLKDALLDAKKTNDIPPLKRHDYFCSVPLFAFPSDPLRPCTGVYSPLNRLGDDKHERFWCGLTASSLRLEVQTQSVCSEWWLIHFFSNMVR